MKKMFSVPIFNEESDYPAFCRFRIEVFYLEE